MIEKKITVCMFTYYFPPQYSGAALQAINLAKKLRDKGIEIFFIAANHDNLPEKAEIEGFEVYRIKQGEGELAGFILWKNIFNLVRHYKIDFDILHSHGAYLRNSFVGPLSKFYGKKSLIKVSLSHNDLYGLGRGERGRLHKWFISMVDRYVSMSREITDELKAYRFPEEKIREISNGVDIKRFCLASLEEKVMLREKAGLPKNGPMLLYVGGISRRKNVKWLVERWNEFCCDYPGFLTVVGPVSREDSEMKLYNCLKEYEDKLRDKLYFVEYQDKIEDFYKMADIFVLPSTNEGMPNVVLEAMSSGLPCLVNRVSGAEDIINGGNGLLFDVRHPETFIEGLFRLKDKTFRSEIGRNARERVINAFSLESIAERYIDLYEEMLKD